VLRHELGWKLTTHPDGISQDGKTVRSQSRSAEASDQVAELP
jgi:hypothetical protein